MNAPTILPVLSENIPQLLKGTRRWGVWRKDKDKPDGRYGKIPIHPETGYNTNAHNPKIWRDFVSALQIYKNGLVGPSQVAGVSFDLPNEVEPITEREDGVPLYLIGLDFDNCVHLANGKHIINAETKQILTQLNWPYHEISPSGTGLRVFVLHSTALKGGNKGQKEMYSRGRFLTVTGHGSGEIKEVGSILCELEATWFGDKKTKNTHAKPSEIKNAFANALGGFELPDEITEGERNAKMLAYIGSLRGKGMQEGAILATVKNVNQSKFKPPLDEDELEDLVNRYANSSSADERNQTTDGFNCSDPLPVEFGLPNVPAFEEELLPKTFIEFVMDAADRMQCPPEFIAAPLVVSAAAALGNRIVISPKAHDTGWRVAATLWGAIIARPGMMKSPAISAALKPLYSLEQEMKSAHQAECDIYEFEKLQFTANKKVIERRMNKGEQVSIAEMPKEPDEPKPERVITNDSTVQKLGILCATSPRGILVLRDELTGWIENLSVEGREADRAFYLEGWNGLNSFQVDRVGRQSDNIKTLNLLVLGGIQPSKLQSHIRSSTRGDKGDDGLIQRFQILVWPDQPKTWKNVDRKPNLKAENTVQQTFKSLREIDPIAIGANVSMTGEGPAWLHFTDEGQSLFDQWRAKLEQALRSNDRHPATESHLAKYRSLVPALALLFHLIDGGTGPVSKTALLRAIKWQKYLWGHAKRVYSIAKNKGDFSANALAQKIQAGKLTDGFNMRDVYRHGWAALSTREDAAEAIEILVERNWLYPTKLDTGGRTSTSFKINPKIKDL